MKKLLMIFGTFSVIGSTIAPNLIYNIKDVQTIPFKADLNYIIESEQQITPLVPIVDMLNNISDYVHNNQIQKWKITNFWEEQYDVDTQLGYASTGWNGYEYSNLVSLIKNEDFSKFTNYYLESNLYEGNPTYIQIMTYLEYMTNDGITHNIRLSTIDNAANASEIGDNFYHSLSLEIEY